MRDLSAVKVQARHLLLMTGVAFPQLEHAQPWGRRVTQALRALPVEGAVRFKLHELLDRMELVRYQAVRADHEIRTRCRGDEELHNSMLYVMSVPGVAWRVGSHFLARVGDWRQLPAASSVSCFCGLTPSEHSTGDRVRRGSITRAGDPKLRCLLVQGAWMAVRKDEQLRALYERVCARHPRQHASQVGIVAVARKMVVLMCTVLRERRVYVPDGPPCKHEEDKKNSQGQKGSEQGRGK
jgi:transposase